MQGDKKHFTTEDDGIVEGAGLQIVHIAQSQVNKYNGGR